MKILIRIAFSLAVLTGFARADGVEYPRAQLFRSAAAKLYPVTDAGDYRLPLLPGLCPAARLPGLRAF